jgi:RNA polymerase sigma-70 factor (ECF subfamily)
LPREPQILGKFSPSPPLSSEVQPESAVASEWSKRLVGSDRPISGVPSFEDVYRRFFRDVCRWVRALGGPDAEREDLVQDVFVIVHRRLPEFDGENLHGWLYQITRHRVRVYRRLRWFRVLLGGAEVDDTFASPSESPETSLGSREKERLLASLLSRLPEPQRAAFVLFEIEGYTGEEIAKAQRVPINTVWARIHKARAKLASNAARLRRDR